MTSKYDNKDCSGWDLSGARDMDNLTIEGLCLSNETPNARVLPPNLRGTTFSCCNLANVLIPPGNVVKNCNTMRFAVQNDGEDWEPLPMSPVTLLPREKSDVSVVTQKITEIIAAKAVAIDAVEEQYKV